MSSYRKTMRQVREEMLVINEAKYELYHKDFSTAMQHAYKMAKKLHGITVDPKEIDDKVASGPRKPSEGKTNSYRLEGDKGSIQVQVYNKGGPKPFELNFYKEEVELDEVGGSAFGGTIDKIQKVVDDKQATKIDGVMVDTFTASLIMKIWNGVSKQNQDKMRKMKVTQLAKAAYKLAGMKEEVDLDEGTKQVLAHGGKGQYKAVRDGSITKVMYKGKVVGTADFDSGADSFFVSMKGVKGQKSFDDAQAMVDYFAKNKITEEVELDEAEDFKPHKMYDPETGEAHDAKTMEDHLRMKKMGYSHEKPKVEESAASDARRAMAADPSTKQKFSKNVSATDDDIKAADKNIMMQMRKAVSLRGNKVEFMDKKKVEIPQKVAQAVLDKYNSQKKPADKEKFQAKVSKSYKSMLTALKEQNEINNKNNSLHELKSLVREMKGKNNG
jgi:hypothetical protein